MKVLVQKCSYGAVNIGTDYHEEIRKGYVLFVGFTHGDDLEKIKFLAHKVAHLRIFEDEEGVMNRSILDENGCVLSISQFTLYADATKGNRPSYIKAMNSEDAIQLYDLWNQELSKYVRVKAGVFGADMIIEIHNIGPTTILLEK